VASGVQAAQQAVEDLHLATLLHKDVCRREHGALLPLRGDEIGVVAVLSQLHQEVVQTPDVHVCMPDSCFYLLSWLCCLICMLDIRRLCHVMYIGLYLDTLLIVYVGAPQCEA
jgi:hypothetical protein